MEDRELTFDQIVGSDVRMIPFHAEDDFNCMEAYEWLWQEIKPLVNGAFDFDSWTDETVDKDDGDSVNIRLTIKDTIWDIELEKMMGFIDLKFIDKLNEIIETLDLSENRFREVCPEGLSINSEADHIVFLPKEIVKKLDANGYGKWDKKWIGL